MVGSLFQNTVNVINIRVPTTNKEDENASEVSQFNMIRYDPITELNWLHVVVVLLTALPT